jgi:hypothetical protein
MHRGRQTEYIIWRSYPNHKNMLHYHKCPSDHELANKTWFAVSSRRLDQSSSMLVRRSIGFNEAIMKQVITQRALPSGGPVVEYSLLHARDDEQSDVSCDSWLIRRLGLFNELVMSGFITLNQSKWVHEVVICRPITVHPWLTELLSSVTLFNFGTTSTHNTIRNQNTW